MADFRRWALVLAVFALFAGLASAQSAGSTMNCTVTAVTTAARVEGYTEKLGDILIQCTGGKVVATGSNIDRVNITVNTSTTVTSRLYSTGASEALLYIDSPQSGETVVVPGYGPDAPQILCTALTGGCPAVVGAVNSTVAFGNTPTAVAQDGHGNPAANVYIGTVSGNSVTFYGVPVLPPVTNQISRTFRIKNVRGVAAGLPSSTYITASVVSSDTSVLPIQTQQLNIAQVLTSMTPSVKGSLVGTQCNSLAFTQAALLNFKEEFATAFKTRVVATTADGDALGTGDGQISPSAPYNSESGVIMSNGYFKTPAGLADFGTRFKATFSNIPQGVSVYVSLHNVSSDGTPMVNPAPGNTSTAPYATLITGDTAAFSAVSADADHTGYALISTGGSGTAVWEVTNADPFSPDTFQFAVALAYDTDLTQPVPALGAGTVSLSYAPTSSSSAWAQPSTTLKIPRFATPAANSATFVTINLCSTTLLWPYVTNLTDWETGLAIANTSNYPTSAAGQSGACTLSIFGQDETGKEVSTVDATTDTVAPGTTWIGNLSGLIDGSSLAGTKVAKGFVIAVCDFQYAHGYGAIISSTSGSVSGYLALVMNPAQLVRDSTMNLGETLGN